MSISPFFAKGLKQPKRSDFCSRTFKSVADVVKSDPDLTRSGLVLGSSYSNLVRSVCNEKNKDVQRSATNLQSKKKIQPNFLGR